MITLFLALVACNKEEAETDLELPPPEELIIPGVDGVDLEALFEDAVRNGIAADNRNVWEAHRASLAYADVGCPNFYAGTPDLEIDDIDEDARGYSWLDQCIGQRRFGGFQYWENNVNVEGSLTDLSGRSIDAQRELLGDGLVSDGDEVLFEFDGDGADSLSKIEDSTGFTRWTYSSLVNATVTGSFAFPADSPTPGGFRTDMYLFYTGGDVDGIEARGNVYYFDHRLIDRFDSIAMDIEFAGPTGATPDVCTTEPRGWIGVRDSDAYWYDVVFEPRSDPDATNPDYEPDPYTSCDGCGTLYIRGIPQEIQVCPDLSFLWQGALVPPEGTDFALSMRNLLEAP